MRSRSKALLAGAVTAVVTAALVVSATAGTGKGPVKLTLADPEGAGRPASLIAERFATRLEQLSRGKIEVTVLYEAGKVTDSTPTQALEANLVRMVRRGKAQLAIVPSRSFEAQGVTTFQAVQAPFLITTESRMRAITTGSIAGRLQEGLAPLGLQGLGLVPENLRRPFGFDKSHPLVSAADFDGAHIRAVYSRATYDLLRTLGATPVDLNGDDYDAAVTAGKVQGAESSFAIANDGGVPAISVTAGNLAFFPKVDVLVANGAAVGKLLTPAQRQLLRRAAADTRSWWNASTSERRDAADYCAMGNRIVQAPAAAIEELRAKSAHLVELMSRTPSTARLIAAIRALPEGSSGIPSCGYS